MNARADRKACTRATLLEAAYPLFKARGYDRVGVRDIASRAGYSIGALFNCFVDKGELWRAAMAQEPEYAVVCAALWGHQ